MNSIKRIKVYMAVTLLGGVLLAWMGVGIFISMEATVKWLGLIASIIGVELMLRAWVAASYLHRDLKGYESWWSVKNFMPRS